MKKNGRLVKVGELARRAGVLPSTVRYYTDLGLLKPAGRTQGGFRLYSVDTARTRLAEIQRLTRRRVSLAELKKKGRFLH